MRFKRQCLCSTALLVGLLVAAYQPYSAVGLSQIENFDTVEFKEWKNNIQPYQYWFNNRISQDSKNEIETQVEIKILPSGKVESLKLTKSSGFPDVDLSCLASFIGKTTYAAMPKLVTKYPPLPGGVDIDTHTLLPENLQVPYQAIFVFNHSKTPLPFSAEKKYVEGHLKRSKNVLLMHLIPVGIESHYPGLFSAEELSDESNIIAINPKSDLNQVANAFLDGWQTFIIDHKTASKEEVLKEAESLKNKNAKLLVVGK